MSISSQIWPIWPIIHSRILNHWIVVISMNSFVRGEFFTNVSFFCACCSSRVYICNVFGWRRWMLQPPTSLLKCLYHPDSQQKNTKQCLKAVEQTQKRQQMKDKDRKHRCFNVWTRLPLHWSVQGRKFSWRSNESKLCATTGQKMDGHVDSAGPQKKTRPRIAAAGIICTAASKNFK